MGPVSSNDLQTILKVRMGCLTRLNVWPTLFLFNKGP